MEGRHTAGPWAAERGDMGGPWQITAGPFGTLATVNTHGDNPEADARLMSAAPDLLDACRALDELDCCLGYVFPGGDWPKLWAALDAARAAIAKATRPVTPTNPVERRAGR